MTAVLDSGSLTAGPGTQAGPDARTEAWRFTPLARLRGLLDGVPTGARLAWGMSLPEGVTRDELDPGDAALATLPGPRDAVAELAVRDSGSVSVVRVPPGAAPAEPAVLRLDSTATDVVAHGHLVLEVGRGADVTVLLEHRGTSISAAMTSVVLGDGARLRLVLVHDWAPTAVHVGQVSTRLGRDAVLLSATLLLGGDLLRVSESVEFGGTGGDASLTGVWLTTDGQHHESRLSVDHAVPHCRSRVASRGALQGARAHSVWVGDVLIRAAAVGTDTYEYNRNLVLTDGARADSVPNLEIETGEVAGAGHASATGRFDDEQLFYLMARGIPEGEARRLVVRGFFAEVLDRVTAVLPELGGRLSTTIEERV